MELDLNLIKELGLGSVALFMGLYLIRTMFLNMIEQNKESNDKLSVTTERVLSANEQLVQTNREISVENRKAIEELTREIKKLNQK